MILHARRTRKIMGLIKTTTVLILKRAEKEKRIPRAVENDGENEKKLWKKVRSFLGIIRFSNGLPKPIKKM